uniref:Uncharacterized protein n=1 Tax=Odontella aurita TaxID=265563 RepID=A0A7S4IZU8_9STRA|mmetsp:Transcript_34326/g.102826  ORF Transcript_34326/g.102826 Transcript_34326/m.102826 type:complete len:158 (+) Transcript_34326:148-621(+)
MIVAYAPIRGNLTLSTTNSMKIPRKLSFPGREWMLSLIGLVLMRFRSSSGANVLPEIFGEENAIHVNYAGSKLDDPHRRPRHIPGITSYSPYGHYDDVSATKPNPFLEEEEGHRTSDLLGYVGEVPRNLTGLFEELKVLMMSLPTGAIVDQAVGGRM